MLRIRSLYAEVYLWKSCSHSQQLCIKQPLSQEGDLSFPFLSTHPLLPFALVLLLRQQTGTSYCWRIMRIVILLHTLFKITTLSILITVLWMNVRLQEGSRHVSIVSQCKRLFSAIYSFTVGEGIPLPFRAPRTIQMPGAYILPTAELGKICSQEEQLRKSFPIPRTAFHNSMREKRLDSFWGREKSNMITFKSKKAFLYLIVFWAGALM